MPLEVGELHRSGHFEDFANRLGRQMLLRQLTLAFENELQRFPEIDLGLFQRLTL